MKGDGPIRAMTIQHGGSGGGQSLNVELTGYFILFLSVSNHSLPRNYRTPETHRRLWSPAQ
jgi:hypothetical protein